MKAILQNFRNGEMKIEDVPPPTLKPNGLLVRNVASLVSAGTERAIIELAKMNPLQKARARPDLVRKVLNRAGQEGLIATAKIVMNLVNTPLPLGYSCAGIVESVGLHVSDIQPGQAVACAGLGFANHAEVVYVPRNLAVPIPDGVAFQDAAFVTVGAIALHGFRQAEVGLGESVVVLGLGLVGQLTAQICKAAGCRVFGVDLDQAKVELAVQLGADGGIALNKGDIEEAVSAFTHKRGADAVLITASSKDSDSIRLAPRIARDRSRVIVVGDVGMDLPRREFYDKELELRISRSYGPGRYDVAYEEKGRDYPLGYVRWTENRNMEAFLQLIAQGKLTCQPLITHSFPFSEAEEAYSLLAGKTAGPYIGIVLEYDPEQDHPVTISLPNSRRLRTKAAGEIHFAIVGAGQFAQGILLPALKKVKGVRIESFASGTGLTAKTLANKYRASECTSDYRELLANPDIDAALIATRHDLHGEIAAVALAAGKHVYLEKPLAINEAEFQRVAEARAAAHTQGGVPQLMVGFNRRFSPMALRLKEAFSGAPIAMVYRVNAGPNPSDHWTQDVETGGGRIVGEVCHFIDLMQYLCGARPVEVFASPLAHDEGTIADPDNVHIQIRFSDSSLGTIAYMANGDSAYEKERIEVFGSGRVGVIQNWRRMQIQGSHGKSRMRQWLGAAKGINEELQAFVESIRTGEPAIPWESLVDTTLCTFAIQRSIRSGQLERVLTDEIGANTI